MTKAAEFGFDSTADEVLQGLELGDRTILITGGSGGLGLEAARALAGRGATIIIAARDPDRTRQAAATLVEETGNDRIHTLDLDLAALDSIRAAGGSCLDRHPRIDVLINNAGVMACPLTRTADGFEMQFGVCHLGHFLLTALLLPALLAAAPARVVNLSSAGHRFGGVDFEDPNFHRRNYDKWQAYGQAKTANILFSVALDRRLSSRGVRSNAVHPGAIAETNLGRHLTQADYAMLAAPGPDGVAFRFKSLAAGAATSVWAACHPALQSSGGQYLADCRIQAVDDTPGGIDGVRSYAVDPEVAQGLWTLSEDMVGGGFEGL